MTQSENPDFKAESYFVHHPDADISRLAGMLAVSRYHVSASLEVKEEGGKLAPDSTYFCLDTEENAFVGAVNIRHRLNERLLHAGGHIGDGIRPSRRGSGLGTEMIGLALEKCREMGIRRVLMCCDKDNPASARTIQKNGGRLENEVLDGEDVVQRYWIDT